MRWNVRVLFRLCAYCSECELFEQLVDAEIALWAKDRLGCRHETQKDVMAERTILVISG